MNMERKKNNKSIKQLGLHVVDCLVKLGMVPSAIYRQFLRLEQNLISAKRSTPFRRFL